MNDGASIEESLSRKKISSGLSRPSSFFTLIALFALVIHAYLDRQISSIMLPSVKAHFGLSDTMVSLLPGAAFVLPFVLIAPFAGRAADTLNRRRICMIAVIMWSIATIGAGLAMSYLSLFIARVGLGIAQAFLFPAAWSLIADLFSGHKLPRAISIFMIGPYIGSGLALMLGGAVLGAFTTPLITSVGSFEAWRIAMLAAGFLGVAPLLLLLLASEPPRGTDKEQTDPYKISDVGGYLWSERSYYTSFFLGLALQTVAFAALPIWMPTFLSRRFGADLADIGFHYGIAVLVLGCIGALSGPSIGKAMLKANVTDYQLRISFIVSIIATPLAILLPIVPYYEAAVAIGALITLLGGISVPMAGSALQTVTPAGMRGVAVALLSMSIALAGIAAAPTLIALLTDHVLNDPSKIGWSISMVCTVSSLGASIALGKALRSFRSKLLFLSRKEVGNSQLDASS